MSFRSTQDIEDPRLAFPQHECGIFAVFGHPNAAVLTYYGLFALQHRGQESAGIATSTGPAATFQLHRDMGLVSQVFGANSVRLNSIVVPFQSSSRCAAGRSTAPKMAGPAGRSA